jgi:hypothetical protein
MQNQSPLNPFEKVRLALARDPKRTSVMAGLAVIMLILWGRMLMGGPAAATASFIRRSVSALTDGPPAQPRLQASSPVLDWLAKPKAPVSRNLFAIHLDYYARAGDHDKAGDAAVESMNATGDEADQKRERQILLENLQSQASKMKLQTTMMGNPPQAMVNGELVKEGDIIGGFVVVQIQPRRVVIQQDGVVLEIVMP